MEGPCNKNVTLVFHFFFNTAARIKECRWDCIIYKIMGFYGNPLHVDLARSVSVQASLPFLFRNMEK